MLCTMVLSVFFFVVVLARELARTCLELSATDDRNTLQGSGGLRASVERWEHCLQRCAQSLNLAPMLCILFMAARMRALQLDPKMGRVQPWAELCFDASTASVVAHVL